MSSKKKQKKEEEFPDVIVANIQNTNYAVIEKVIERRMHWMITDSTTKNDIFWCDTNVNVNFCLQMKNYQFVNHFPGTGCISRKVDLSKNFFQIQKHFPEQYNFHPKSFVMPTEKLLLKHYLEKAPPDKRTFLIKPDLGSQGKGIYLIQDPESAVNITELAIAQECIPPYLIDGLKFDFRVYALITSIDPLRVYIYKDGLARFCTEPYEEPNSKNLGESYKFLTNYAVNKTNTKFEQFHDGQGHKRSITCVLRQMLRNGVDIDKLWAEIERIVLLTIIIGQPIISHYYHSSIKTQDGRSRCFEILGFDIIVDKDLKPWVLEVNHSPSLACESDFDAQIKEDLISETLKIMDLNPIFRARVINIEKERTIQRINGNKQSEIPCLFFPDRETKLAKTTGWKQIYPSSESSIYDRILSRIEDLPKSGIEETAAFRYRRRATKTQIEEMEKKELQKKKEPKPFITSWNSHLPLTPTVTSRVRSKPVEPRQLRKRNDALPSLGRNVTRTATSQARKY